MHWLDYLWQGALVVMPFLFAAFKSTDTAQNRWSKILLPVAETTWQAVEAWKKQNAKKPEPAASKAEFMRLMQRVHPKLSDADKEKLSAWADTRSLAAKK